MAEQSPRTDKTRLHNELTERFAREVIGPAVRVGASEAELMVLFESIQVGMLLTLWRLCGTQPRVAVGMLELSQHRAIERFAAIDNERRDAR